jgi:hypothetical protein
MDACRKPWEYIILVTLYNTNNLFPLLSCKCVSLQTEHSVNLERVEENAGPNSDLASLRTTSERLASSSGSVLALAKKIEQDYGGTILDLHKFKDEAEFAAR